jgi:hypothetical protein
MSFGSSVISTYNTGTYTVKRYANGTNANGHYTPATPTTITIKASVQPLSGRDLKDLPEGQRADDLRTLYTTTRLYTVSANGNPDVITIEGDRYRVTKVEYFGILSGHYRVLCERLEVP